MINQLPAYKKLYKTDKRYILLTGGRASAKSFHASTFLTLLTYETGHTILFSRYTMTSANKSIIPELLEKTELLEVSHHFTAANNEVVNNVTGSKIIFSGIKTSSGNQTANLKSLHNITTWILDESEEMTDEREFDKIDLSVRSVNQKNRVILVLNPTTREHWIWKRWFENSFKYIDIDGEQVPVSTHPDVCHIHTTYLDNLRNIPQDYLTQIQRVKETNPVKYKHIILGGWIDKPEGVIFENWKEGEMDASLPFIYGMDFGYVSDPTALVKVSINEKEKVVYLQEILYEKKLTTQNIVNLLPKDSLIVADNAEPRLIDEIKMSKFNIVPCVKGADSVRQGILKMLEYRLVISTESNNLKKELNNYSWNDKKSHVPIDAYNHLIDAARYAVQHLTQKKAEFYVV
jgi:phage terminase large subunit